MSKNILRIIFSIDYSPWSPYSGGAQRSTHNLASTFALRGFDVHVIYTRTPFDRYAVPQDLPYNMHWATLPGFKSKRSNYLRWMSGRFVRNIAYKLISSSDNCVFHGNGEEAGWMHHLKSTLKFALVNSPRHPHYPDVFRKHKHIPFGKKLWLLLSEGKYLFQYYAARNADICCPPSNYAGLLLRDEFYISASKIQPVPNGVPNEFLSYHRKDNPNPEFLFFGRFDYTKGVDTLIDCWKILGNDAPQLHIVGNGKLESTLREQVHQSNLDSVITFHPWLSHHEIAQLMVKTRMCILPSRFENFSLSILSSMCVGVPVLSTRVGGSPEIIDHKKDGFLVNPDSADEMAEVVRFAISEPDKLNSMGDLAAHKIRGQFTWEHTCDKYLKIYNMLLKNINSN